MSSESSPVDALPEPTSEANPQDPTNTVSTIDQTDTLAPTPTPTPIITNKQPVHVDVGSVPVKITKIDIRGLKQTRTDFIEKELEGIKQAKDFKQLQYGIATSVQDLQALGVFNVIDLQIESDSITAALDEDGFEPAILKVRLNEKKRVGARTSVDRNLNTGENSANLKASVKNVFGGCERFEASVSMGDDSSRNYEASLTKPRMFGTHASGSITLLNTLANLSAVSSYAVRSRGFIGSLLSPRSPSSSSPYSPHKFDVEALWKDTFPSVRSPAFASKTYSGPSSEIIQESGVSVKTALKYTYTQDQIDNLAQPRKGFFSQTSTELAGPPGDTSTFKLENESKLYIPITKHFSIGLSSMHGLVAPWSFVSPFLRDSDKNLPLDKSSNLKSSVNLSSRFHLGGPSSVRGFAFSGLGPMDDQDSIGGDFYSAFGFSFNFDLPNKFGRDNDIRLSLFGNAGTLLPLGSLFGRNNLLQSLQTNSIIKPSDFLDTFRTSIGAALTMPLGAMGHVDVHLAKTLKHQATDQTRTFNVGFGWKFL